MIRGIGLSDAFIFRCFLRLSIGFFFAMKYAILDALPPLDMAMERGCVKDVTLVYALRFGGDSLPLSVQMV